ncbi:MAG: GtrA family protein [Candidatus Dojkabacteria bacterium]
MLKIIGGLFQATTKPVNKLIDLTQKIPLLKILPVKFYRFAVVGGTGFIFDFIILQIFYFGVGVDERIEIIRITDEVTISFAAANILSVVIGSFFGYILNKYWSFEDKSGENVASQFSKYLMVAIVNGILNNIFFGLLLYEFFLPLGLREFFATSIAKVFSTSFQAVTSYVMYRYVIFKSEEEVISEATLP